jgi:uncharacterized protein (TIGR03437 family)
VVFEVQRLSLSSLNPKSTGAAGAEFALTVSGAAFLPGAAIYWNGSPLPSTYVSRTTLTAQVPAGLIAAAGTASIRVGNPGGALSSTLPFVVEGLQPPAVGLTPDGIVNAASSLHSVATGSLISIYGTNLAPQLGPAVSAPLPLEINGTSVVINDRAAPLSFVSPSQINAQVPFETAIGPATLAVRTNGASSSPAAFVVQGTAPGVVTTNSAGRHALAQNADDYSINSSVFPVQRGHYVIVYVTGQGQVDNPVPNGAAAPPQPLSVPLAPVLASIGGKNAPVAFAGLAPGMVGVLQISRCRTSHRESSRWRLRSAAWRQIQPRSQFGRIDF